MVFDENGWGTLENPNLENGEIYTDTIEVIYKWHVDEPEVTELHVVKEYPNGGVDVEPRVISPEKGHWEKVDPSIPVGSDDIPADYPHDNVYVENVTIERYHEYTSKELADMESLNELAEKEKKRQEFLDSLPSTVTETDESICVLYEQSQEQADVIAGQDAAICELYEMMIGE